VTVPDFLKIFKRAEAYHPPRAIMDKDMSINPNENLEKTPFKMNTVDDSFFSKQRSSTQIEMEKIQRANYLMHRTFIDVNFAGKVEGSARHAIDFEPEIPYIKVMLGEPALAFFKITNNSKVTLTGNAIYQVLPFNASPYFSKIECFCFEEQVLPPKQTLHLPVLFQVHPDLLKDPRTQLLDSLQLVYTMTVDRPVRKPNPETQALFDKLNEQLTAGRKTN